jgi:hypothetical protein
MCNYERPTFHLTNVTVTRNGKTRNYLSGQTIRPRLAAGFSDSLILGISPPDKYGSAWVRIARPHCMVTCQGTTGPDVALQVETYEISLVDLFDRFMVVDPHSRNTGHFNNPETASPDEVLTINL